MRSAAMADAREHLDRKEIESFIGALAFVREYSIQVASAVPGEVVIELPFNDRFSGPPGQFPASMVGTAGDGGAAFCCLAIARPGSPGCSVAVSHELTGVAIG